MNFERMIRLSILHLAVNRLSLLLTFAVFISVSILLETSAISVEGEKLLYVELAMPMAIIICSSWGMNRYRNSESSVSWMTLPATGLEKWLTGFLWTALVAPAVVLIAVLLLHTTVLGFLHEGQQPQIVKQIDSIELLRFFKLYFWTQPLFFLGTVFFKNHPILKTVSTIVLSYLFVLIGVLVIIIIHQRIAEMHGVYMEFKRVQDLYLGAIKRHFDLIYTGIMILCLVLSWFCLNRSNVR